MFDDDEDDDDVNAEEIVTEKEIELPFPVTESSAKLSSLKIGILKPLNSLKTLKYLLSFI